MVLDRDILLLLEMASVPVVHGCEGEKTATAAAQMPVLCMGS